MSRLLLALALLFGMSAVATATPTEADPAYGVKYTQERITKLPQDQDKFYLSVIGNPADPKVQNIYGWFESNKELKSFQTQTHFNKMDITTRMYTDKYAKSVPNLPCIRVQTAGGVTLYQCSGDNIPMSSESLTKALNTECLRRWRDQHCKPSPKPAPQPAPQPAPDAPAPDEAAPDVQPDVEPDNSFPWILLVSLIAPALLIGAGIGVAKQWKATYNTVK